MEIMLFKHTLEQLAEDLDDLASRLSCAPSLNIALPGGRFSGCIEAQSLLSHHLTNLYFSDEEPDGRHTPICIGVAGVDKQTLDLAESINRSKDSLRVLASGIRDNIQGKRGKLTSNAARDKGMREKLAEVGLGRLSLRQCYRHLALLSDQPKSIRFSYSTQGKSLRRISVDKAIELLDKMGFESYQAQIDREILSNLSPNTQLVKVQRLAGYYKANVFFEHRPTPETIPAFLPILYPFKSDRPVQVQQYLPVAQQNQHKRAKRSDSKICDTPLIKTLDIYTYK